MTAYLWIAIGSALGGVSRYALSVLAAQWFGESFPWGTLIVNVTGSLTIGFFATLTGPDGRILASPDIRRFVMVGVLGGYTTFSAFSLQTLGLVQGGEAGRAGLNVLASVALCLASVWIGHVAASNLNGLKGS